MLLVGFDAEMTGLDPAAGHRLVQVGVALPRGSIDGDEPPALDLWSQDIGWSDGDYTWTEEALSINGFTHDRITKGPAANTVDTLLANWLAERGGGPGQKLIIPVGWRVADADLPFIRRTLPQTASAIVGPAVELFGVARSFAGRVHRHGRLLGYRDLVDESQEWAQQELERRGMEPAWHDAGYDAAAGALAWWWLRSQIGPTEAP